MEELIDGFLIYLSKDSPDKRLPNRIVCKSILEKIDNKIMKNTSLKNYEKLESDIDSLIIFHSRDKPEDPLPSRNEMKNILTKILSHKDDK